jgi:hypothetical protein
MMVVLVDLVVVVEQLVEHLVVLLELLLLEP